VSHLAPVFDPDVFVSYSHGDPVGGHAPLRDWTQALITRLEQGLHALETEFDDLDLFIDPKIDPTAHLSDDLRGKAGACGVLMIVMSKRYLKSRWCQDELTWFGQQIQERMGSSGRVFVIRAQETDTNQWPEFLRDSRGYAMTGFSFYDPENGEPWGFQLREPGDDYFKELTRLRIWLVKRLRELRERAADRARDKAEATARSKAPGPRLIYLHAPPNSEAPRAEIAQALKEDGIAPVTPVVGAGRGLADWQSEAKQRISMAKHCEALALLRVGDEDRFLNDLFGIGVNERKEMSGSYGAPLPCAVLDKIGDGLPVDLSQFRIERFDVNKADWRSQFRAWLDAARAATAGAAP
jgi:hypothetical protein